MKNFVFDSFALLVFFQKQKDWKKVENMILLASQEKVEIKISLINYGEIYYTIAREHGMKQAEKVINIVNVLPIQIVAPDKKQTLEAATIKAGGGISYSDCFAAALTMSLGYSLVTGDREFKKLEDKIDIEWIEK
jgi:uncharacterized protein